MNDDKLIEMINLYFDGELEKSREPQLFSQLSANDEAREYFKKLNSLEAAISDSSEELPDDLDERILKSVASMKSSALIPSSRQKSFITVSLTASILLLIISSLLFLKLSSYDEKVDDLTKHVKIQSRTIEMLYNSLPGIEVEATLKNAIIIKPNS